MSFCTPVKCVVPENFHTPPTEGVFWFEPPIPPEIPV